MATDPFQDLINAVCDVCMMLGQIPQSVTIETLQGRGESRPIVLPISSALHHARWSKRQEPPGGPAAK